MTALDPMSEIRRLFPRASESFIRENTKAHRPIPDASPQCDKAPALGGTIPRKKSRVGRIVVLFTGYRVHPLDPDGFAGSVKDLLDGLRHAHVLPEDDFWTIRLQTEQEKVGTYADEKTTIKITYPNYP